MVELLVSQPGVDVNAVNSRCHWTALQYAAHRGHRGVVGVLLRTPGVNVRTIRSVHGQSAFHSAAQEGHVDILEDLLATNVVDINALDMSGKSAFHYAAERGHFEVAEKLLATKQIDVNHAAGPDNLSSSITSGMKALHFAARRGHIDIVKLLATTPGIKVNTVDDSGCNVLHHAAVAGRCDVLKFLLSVGALGVNTKNIWKETPLHYAAQAGDLESMHALISCGETIDINSRGRSRRTPLLCAVFGGHVKVAELIAKVRGVDLSAASYVNPEAYEAHEGETAFHCATFEGYHELLAFLVSHPGAPAAVNVVNHDRNTALHVAVERVDLEAVRTLLLADGIDANKRTEVWRHRGLTPLQVAIARIAKSRKYARMTGEADSKFKNKMLKLLSILVASPHVDLNAVDYEGMTALHHAARGGDHETVDLLLKQGDNVDANALDASGATPLQVAIEMQHVSIVHLLQSAVGLSSNVADSP